MGARGNVKIQGERGGESDAAALRMSATQQLAAPLTAVDDTKVEDWFYDRYQSARVNGNRWFVAAILLGMLACLAVGAVVVLTPLKTVHPFLVEANSVSGEVRVLRPFSVADFAPSDAVSKS